MKKQYHSQKSKQTNKKVKFKFDPKDSSIMKVKWNSPNDKKGNILDINADPKKFNTINIEDNH